MLAMLHELSRTCRVGAMVAVSLTLFSFTASGIEPVTLTDPRPTAPPALPNAPFATVEAPASLDGPTLENSPSWSEILHTLVLTAIPDKYEDLRHWGKKTEVFGGVRVQQRGLNIRVSERKQTINHGAWHRYKIELIEPVKTLKLVIDQIRPLGKNEFQFQIRLASKLRCRGDFEHWVLGVKGLNLTVVSEAEVRIVANCQLAIRTESNRKSLLPDLILEPRVNSVNLFLTNIDVKRIGEIRGDIAEGIGDGSRHYIENLLQAQESRVTKKANEAIDKKRVSMRIPMSRIW